MVITIKKRPMPIVLLELILITICFGRFFSDILGFPSAIKYVNDFLLIVVLAYVFRKLIYGRALYLSKDMKKILLVLLVFVMVYIVSSIVEKPPILSVLWGIRNTLKGLIFFAACIILLKKEDIERIANKINMVFILNFLICLYEFFVLDLEGDYIGGAFGTEQGCNAYLNVLLIIVTVWNALLYAEKRQRIGKTLFYIILCAIASGMSELKIYVIEIPIILITIGAFSKGVWRKIVLGVAGVGFAMVCIRLIENLIPGWENFFTWENMLEMVTGDKGYTNQGDLNRFTAIQMLNERIFYKGTNWFGIGLGNAEYSDSFMFLQSDFYQKHSELNYGWFSVAKTYIELGYFGILSMLFVWINSVIVGIKGAIKNIEHSVIYCKMTVVIAIMTPLLFVYNATMHMDASCLIYFCMAFVYIALAEPMESQVTGECENDKNETRFV